MTFYNYFKNLLLITIITKAIILINKGTVYAQSNSVIIQINPTETVDAIAALGEDGQIYVSITNIDPNNAVKIDLSLAKQSITNVKGETLSASAIDAINTFDKPDNVSPKPVKVNVTKNQLSVTLQAQSVTVISLTAKK